MDSACAYSLYYLLNLLLVYLISLVLVQCVRRQVRHLPPKYNIKANTARERTRSDTLALRGMPHDDSCNETVVYAFLTRGALPLWPVWESYLAGCPKGVLRQLSCTRRVRKASATTSR